MIDEGDAGSSMIGRAARRMVAWPGSLEVRTLKLIVVGGFAARIALWLLSEGSSDIRTWARFARHISRSGLLDAYLKRPEFNHPPLMGLWSQFAAWLAGTLEVPFAQVFKLLPLAADFAAIPLLLFIVRQRGDSERDGWRAAAIFSTSLTSLWITSHHGNTDSVCALLTCFAVALVNDGKRPFLAGLAFAAALNVKLLPLVLAPALFAMQARSARDAARFSLGVGVGLLPFLYPIVNVGAAFYQNAIAYNSIPNRWGLHFFMHQNFRLPEVGPVLRSLDEVWAVIARYVIMASSLALGIWGRRTGRSPFVVAAMAMAMFLVLTPGIGVQYFCFPVLLLTVVNLRRAFLYSAVCGVFVSGWYLNYRTSWLPLISVHHAPLPLLPAVFGIPVWLLLVELVVSRLRQSSRPAPGRSLILP